MSDNKHEAVFRMIEATVAKFVEALDSGVKTEDQKEGLSLIVRDSDVLVCHFTSIASPQKARREFRKRSHLQRYEDVLSTAKSDATFAQALRVEMLDHIKKQEWARA